MALPNVSGHEIVEPIGEAYICKSVPLDSTYTHSLNVDQLQNGLQSAITSYSKYHLIGQSFTRITNNTMRVEITANDLKDCNYIMIRNGDFFGNNNKWYYCFIENKEYINNQTTDISFKVDYLLTYWYDFTIPRNFIEREHCAVADDVIGKNLVDEALETGELIVQGMNKYTYDYLSYSTAPPTWWVVIMYAPNYQTSGSTETKYIRCVDYAFVETTTMPTEATAPQQRNGIVGGFCYVAFDTFFGDIPDAIKLLQRGITAILGISGEILGVYLIPNEMYTDNFLSNVINVHSFALSRPTVFKSATSSLTHTPKNKKLYQYPYSQVIVSNNNGETSNYKWELFYGANNASFGIITLLSPEPQMFIYPAQYRGVNADYENGLLLDNFPAPSWSEDSYTKWWAQNKTNFGLSIALQARMSAQLLASTVSPRAQAFTRGMGGNAIGRTMAQMHTARATPDTMHVQNNSPVLQGLQNRIGFTAYAVGLTAEKAKIIDDYFELYGYACHEEKIPNFAIPNARRSFWNYCKMQNAQIEAQTGTGRGLPQEAQKAIEEIFNNGITLWSDIAQIGNYNNDNHS
jgi:hypothetical protein